MMVKLIQDAKQIYIFKRCAKNVDEIGLMCFKLKSIRCCHCKKGKQFIE